MSRKKSPIYASEALRELAVAARPADGAAFARFQLEMLNALEPDIRSDFLSVTLNRLDELGRVRPDFLASMVNIPPALGEHYRAVAAHDIFTTLLTHHSGMALFSEALSPHRNMPEDFRQEVFTAAGLRWILGISFSIPFMRDRHLTMNCIRSPDSGPYPPTLGEERAEYLLYPFFLCWLHVHGRICHDTLREWLCLCTDMSHRRFIFLRTLAGKGIATAAALARGLGISQGAIYRHAEIAYETYLSRCPEAVQPYDGNANRMMTLSRAYHFLGFAPGGTSRPLPRRTFEPDEKP